MYWLMLLPIILADLIAIIVADVIAIMMWWMFSPL